MTGEYLPSDDPGPMHYTSLAMEVGFAVKDFPIREPNQKIRAIRQGWRWLKVGQQFLEASGKGPFKIDLQSAEAWRSVHRPFTANLFPSIENYRQEAEFRSAALQHLAYLRGLTEVPSSKEQEQTTVEGFEKIRLYHGFQALMEILTGFGSKRWRRS